jgi:Protein of unknown function (DUF2945).
MPRISKGDHVSWKWGANTAEGTAAEKFTSDVERTFEGTRVKRKADNGEPAFLIEQEDGDRVLKSESEIKKR